MQLQIPYLVVYGGINGVRVKKRTGANRKTYEEVEAGV